MELIHQEIMHWLVTEGFNSMEYHPVMISPCSSSLVPFGGNFNTSISRVLINTEIGQTEFKNRWRFEWVTSYHSSVIKFIIWIDCSILFYIIITIKRIRIDLAAVACRTRQFVVSLVKISYRSDHTEYFPSCSNWYFVHKLWLYLRHGR